LALLAGISIYLTDAALAAKNPYKTPCHGDAKRVCKMDNEVKAQGCLKQHLSELTPACKAFLAKKK
jgi:hypothetical protein